MVYTPDARLFRRQVESIRERIAGRQPVWAGVGAYRLALDETIARIRTARSSGVSCVVVFSHESFAPSELRRLREEAFPSVAVGPAATSPDERAVDGQR
jgi:dihydrodipicolinate synthase/N-acetylneuraminate lyase